MLSSSNHLGQQQRLCCFAIALVRECQRQPVMSHVPGRMARKSGGPFANGSRLDTQQPERDAYFQGLSEIFDFNGEEEALEVGGSTRMSDL